MSVSMKGKTCVVTGASGGIGKVTAASLARMGARLILVCRDKSKGDSVAREIRAAGGAAELVVADLSSQAEIRRAAGEILAICPRIDVLVNNAGAFFRSRKLTVDGYEATFAVNHLAYFLLTLLLLDRVKASAPARIVNVSSTAHEGAGGIDFDDVGAERGYSGFRRYGQSKLANILFTRELSRRRGRGQVCSRLARCNS